MAITEPVIGDAANAIRGAQDVTWGVARVGTIASGQRRLEASTYLSDGYGLRLAIQSKRSGWAPLEQLAEVWQPSRLKGTTVGSGVGTPFLSAGQVFEARPTPRKWLALERTTDASSRFVTPGWLLVSRSGNVGRVSAVQECHLDKLITDDLLRVVPRDAEMLGWLYAFLKTATFRSIATGTHYGHVIKHLEPGHLTAMPLVLPDAHEVEYFLRQASQIVEWRDQANRLVGEAESLFAQALGHDGEELDLERPVSVPVSGIASGRRRLDGYFHNPVVLAIQSLHRAAGDVQSLASVTRRIWWPDRFKRVFGPNGTPYYSAEDVFNVNAPTTKRIYAGLVGNALDYFASPGWLLMARSGQIYGLNGSVTMVNERLGRYFLSEDLIRIEPDFAMIRAGFLNAALSHPLLGRPLVIRHAYGTSIPHLEPGDVEKVEIPRFAESVEDSIGDKYEEAARLRSAADETENEIVAQAEAHVRTHLHT